MIDSAKVADVLFTHGGRARDWEGYFGLRPTDPCHSRRSRRSRRPPGPAPRRASRRLSATAPAKVKFQVGDFVLAPRLALLDPATTATLPQAVAAASGIDALAHAIEGYASREWSGHGDAYALHALRLIRASLERAVHDPADETARGNMLIAASLAIAPTGTGALGIAHSLAHPCGAHHDVPHGVAIAIVLPATIEYNAAGGEDIEARYADVAATLGVEAGPAEAAAALAAHVRALARSLGLPARLRDVGVPASSLAELAAAALGDACTIVNPREPSETELEGLYRQVD